MVRIAVLSLLLSLLLPASGPIALLVELVSPARSLHTNDVVAVRATVAWGQPDRVELYLDGAPIASLEAPYVYLWDTFVALEGEHRLQVRATLGGRTYSSVERSVTVDRTPPTLVVQTPSPGADNIFIGDPAEVVFSEPILIGDLREGGAHLRDAIGLPVAARVELSDDGTTLRLLPSENVALPTTLTATLDPQITDLAGNSVALSWELWTWEVPEFQSAASLSERGLHPHIAFDGDGRLLVAWIECSGFPCRLEARRGIGATLEPLGGVPATGEVLDLALAVDGRGRPLLAWRERVAWGHELVVARWDGGWERLGENEGLPDEFGELGLDLAVDHDDRPVVVWQQRRPTDGRYVLHAKRWSGYVWDRLGWELNLDPGQDARDPALTIDGNGAPVVMWQESTLTALSSIRVSRWSGGAWRPLGAALNLSPDPAAASYGASVDIVTAPDGTLVAAWHEDSPNGIVDDVMVARWDGMSWRHLPSVDGSDDSSLRPSLALDPAGRPVIAWEELGGINATVRASRWDGSAWEPLGGDLNLDLGLSALSPSVALDVAGRPHIAWKEGGSRPGSIYLKRHNVLPQ